MWGNGKVNEFTSEEMLKIHICNSLFSKVSVNSLLQLADRYAV